MVPRRMKVFDILGTALAATTYAELTAECQKLARTDRPWAIDLTNTQIVTMRRHEPAFRELTSRFDFFVPDGMPLIWSLNRRGANLTDRVYGPKFMRHCVVHSPAPFSHYFLGGSPACLEALQKRLTAEQPELNIVGSRHGYFHAEEEAAIVDEINTLSPDFIWIGLGTPKQQAWVHQYKVSIHRGVILAVGFAFDVNAGTKPDAPEWMQRRGLTWLFRTLSEPRRLASRYLRYNSLFLFYLLKDGLGKERP
jgi:N-acetylglucosaminyldiphosphoundecaprenol N-acetyl-beta-D-mannosaminyltransferase